MALRGRKTALKHDADVTRCLLMTQSGHGAAENLTTYTGRRLWHRRSVVIDARPVLFFPNASRRLVKRRAAFRR